MTARWRREASSAAPEPSRRAGRVLGFAGPTPAMKSCGSGDPAPDAAAVAGRVEEEERNGPRGAGSTVEGHRAAPALNPAATGAATRAELVRARAGESRGSGSPNARAWLDARGWYTIGAAFSSSIGGVCFLDQPLVRRDTEEERSRPKGAKRRPTAHSESFLDFARSARFGSRSTSGTSP